jgi:small conductance mechanosensitive channel
MDSYIENIRLIFATYGMKVLIGLLLFFAGKMASKFISQRVSLLMLKRQINQTLSHFVRQMLYVSLIICVIICVLQYIGIPTAQFMVVLGSAGLAVGLAMKDTLTSLAAGLMLTMLRPFDVGDYVEAGGKGGTVVEVQLLNTILNTPDNVRVVVPNGKILSENISNYTVNGKRRMVINVGVSYDDDLQKATNILLSLLESDERVLTDPAPTVAVTEFAPSAINIVVRPWAVNADYWSLYFDLHKKIKAAFDVNDITIPLPQRVVHMDGYQLPSVDKISNN